ncbi:MAG: hypothetical protein ACJAQW_000272 [Paracoccaceae bacterium]|jgi:hypothetical protein
MSKSAPSAASKRSARGKDVYLWCFGRLFMEMAPKSIAAVVRGIFVWVLLVVSLVIGAGAATAQDIDRNVELSEDADPIPAGGTINYDVAVFNSGIDSAPATTLEIQLPAFAQYTGSTGAITGCIPLLATGPTVVTCNVPALASGASVAMVFSVVASQQGSIMVTANLPATDLDNSNNSADETTTITQGADLELFVSGPAGASSGEVVSFVYTATNNGPNDVASATLQFPVPTGLGNIVAPAGCVETAGRFDCAITGPLALR